ncbi:MAG TPA: ArsA-related P-loop ATPase, partial [Nitriliruptorales bacterium]
LHEDGEWDLLIIDTPPTRSALDFLDAPKRMTSFLEGKLLSLLMKPGVAAGRNYLKAVNVGATAFMKVAGKVTGMALLDDLAQFFRSFEGMYGGFKERAEQVLELLRHSDSRFVVIASPQPPPLREAHFFLDRLQQEGLHSAGVVVNRVHPRFEHLPTGDEVEKAAEAIDHGILGAAESSEHARSGKAVSAALRLADDTRRLAARERRDINAALFGLSPDTLVEVPLLASDVHDLTTLAAIADALTARSR